MNFAARLQATLDLLSEVHAVARPADAVVSSWFRANRQLNEADRGFISDMLYALLHHHARLGWWLARHGRDATPRHRLLAWLALGERLTPDQIRSVFNGKHLAPTLLRDSERGLVIKLQGSPLSHPAMPADVRVECPDWAAPGLHRRFPDSFEPELAALLAPAPLDLRVNPLKAQRDSILQALRDLGLPAEPSPMAPPRHPRQRAALPRPPAHAEDRRGGDPGRGLPARRHAGGRAPRRPGGGLLRGRRRQDPRHRRPDGQ